MAAPRRVVPPTSSTTTRVVWVAEHLTIGPALMISRLRERLDRAARAIAGR